MYRKLLSVAVLAICVVWLTSSAMSQGTTEDSRKSESLLDKIHDTLMGGVLTPKAKRSSSESSTERPGAEAPTRQATSTRSGSAIPQHGTENTALGRQSSNPTTHTGGLLNIRQTDERVEGPTSSISTKPPAGAIPPRNAIDSTIVRNPVSALKVRQPAAFNAPLGTTNVSRSAVAGSASPSAETARPSRMYQRMTALRNSAFATRQAQEPGGEKASVDSSPAAGSALAVSKPAIVARGSSVSPTTVPSSPAKSLSATPSAVQPMSPTPAVGNSPPVARATSYPPSSRVSKSPIVSRSAPVSPAYGRSIANTPLVNPTVTEQSAAAEQTKPTESVAKSPPSTETPTPSLPSERVLFVRQSPVLGVETVGPRQIMVGKESAFEITVSNTGQVAADQTVVNIALPVWTDILGAEVSSGSTNSASSVDGTKEFVWQVGKLSALDEEKLILRIVSRESRPFELAVNWDYTPTASQAMIEVQEPRLEMKLEGPSEVLFGEKEVYRLELANVGTGEATDVKIFLQPIGAGENVAASHTVDVLRAGEKKTIEVELTARQAGSLTIKVDANGDGVEAHVVENVVVLKPGLALSVQAPELQFVGTRATYRIRAHNPGTAAAQNVVVTAKIPAGAKYVSCEQGGLADPGQHSVTWTHDSLEPNAETFFSLTCDMENAGECRLDVRSTAARELIASADATVRVEAMADLVLTINDPTGPVQTGTDAFFEVEIHNRGTKSAEDVEIAAYFSEGVEPLAVDGGQHRISRGQVVFDNIGFLAAGETAKFKIKARADTPGNHVFRVEVNCRPLNARLVNEEMTHFYGNSLLSENKAPVTEPMTSPLRKDRVLTANRQWPPAPLTKPTESATPPVQRQ